MFNIDAEKAIIGRILRNPEYYKDVRDILFMEDFNPGKDETVNNRLVFRGITDLSKERRSLDLVSLAAKTDLPKDHLERYLRTSSQDDNAFHNHISLVIEARVRRGLRKEALHLEDLADEDVSLEGLLYKTEEITETMKKYGVSVAGFKKHHISQVVARVLERMEKLKVLSPEDRYFRTGFHDVDAILGGVFPGDTIYWGARPGMGKTVLLGDVRKPFFVKGKTVITFALEMGEQAQVSREVVKMTGLTMSELRKGEFLDDDYKSTLFFQTLEKISKSRNWYVFGAENRDVLALRRNIYAIAKNEEISLIDVDFLQLLNHRAYTHNRTLELEQVAYILSDVAQDPDIYCPISIAVQLSRKCEEKQDKRPELADLRDSGGIEQAADVVSFIYRDDYYNPDTERPNIAEIIVRKNRNGPTGTAEIYWHPEKMMFRNLQREMV